MSTGSTQLTATRILDPEGVVRTEATAIADRLDGLDGATIGFLDNSKTNADIFLETIASILVEEYGVANAVFRSKANAAIPAGSIATYLAENCDAVVNAYGDCGSCTSWCIYDSVDIEKKGTPVATINSDEFVRLGQSESRSLGMPGLPIIIVEHPLGDVPRETVEARAHAALDEVVHVLTTDADDLMAEYDGKYLAADEELGDEELYCPL